MGTARPVTAAVAAIVVATGVAAAAPSSAHDPGAAGMGQPYQWYHQWHMRPMMGPGQMAHGPMGQGPGPMTWSCMMCHHQTPGMAGHGMGQAVPQRLAEDLTAADVREMMEHRLAWSGNPNVKVGKVEERDDDTIVAEVVTQDGSLVQGLEVNRHTGWMRPAR